LVLLMLLLECRGMPRAMRRKAMHRRASGDSPQRQQAANIQTAAADWLLPPTGFSLCMGRATTSVQGSAPPAVSRLLSRPTHWFVMLAVC
jgi:hypothetical protein